MKNPFRSWSSVPISVALIIAALMFPTASMADEVQLNYRHGSASITGDLVTYQEGIYKLQTVLGVLYVSARLVDCQGATCPSEAQVLLDRQDAGDVTDDQES